MGREKFRGRKSLAVSCWLKDLKGLVSNRQFAIRNPGNKSFINFKLPAVLKVCLLPVAICLFFLLKFFQHQFHFHITGKGSDKVTFFIVQGLEGQTLYLVKWREREFGITA